MERRRWDSDDRFIGIASGKAIAPSVEQLLAHMGRDGWVTEEPDVHLLPRLRQVADGPDSPWRITGAHLTDDSVYVVDLAPASGADGADRTDGAARGLPMGDVLRLLSTIAEAAFFARQIDDRTVDCAMGMLDGDGVFATHGHLIRLRLTD
ncbi:hypothetical protein [Streptosporangium sp. NPDC051022]|uniref:hypothetical protein n=1 Tax=Streptosporangium sp. NPDC051022 TaxID=3155752 RepID=UPI00342F8F5A